ncbi:MAG: hypothetical protein HYT69_00960 [Candidatus Zambryskibacteria bacterium]|nr:hypothetical protein [Candidatus Zambryskibacteria bacterium]
MTPQPTNLQALIRIFTDIIEVTVPVIAGLALLVFFWGLTRFILNVSGDEKAISEGKNLMVWGLIALFIMVSVWGILRFLSSEFGFDPSIALPLIP